MKSFVLLTCSLTALAENGNLPPLIGVVLQPIPKKLNKIAPNLNGRSYVASSYVKWIEAIGGVVVPILADDKEYLKIAENVDGIVFPGGDENITRSTDEWENPYAEFAYNIYAQALQNKTPVLGICQGFQQVAMYTKDAINALTVETNETNKKKKRAIDAAKEKWKSMPNTNLVLEELKVYNKMRKIDWMDDAGDTVGNANEWWSPLKPEEKHLNALNQYVNHHYHDFGYSVEKWEKLLGGVFDILDVDYTNDLDHDKFVNMARMNKLIGNVWAMLPHPEKNAFEHVRDYEVHENGDSYKKDVGKIKLEYLYNQPNTKEHDFDTIMALYSLGQPFLEEAKSNRADKIKISKGDFFWKREDVFKWSINAREDFEVKTIKYNKIPIIFDSVYLSAPQGEKARFSSSAHIFVYIPLFVSLLFV